MIGLRNPEFTGPLYLSSVSAVFVRENFPHIIQLHEITNGVPVHIKTPFDQIVVTSFPANHCPGSVMFLIENHRTRVLYTGDFRLNKKELEGIKAFTEYKNTIDEIYLDSTFLKDIYPNFPTQDASCEAIVKLIEEWTSKGSHKKILLHTSARYGYEWMFIQLYKSLKMKIHVTEANYESYRYIPEMDDVIACNGIETKIHACNIKDCSCNVFSGKDDVRIIRVSAMVWQGWKIGDECVIKDSEQNFRVCYSNHASLSEIRELLLFFKPKQVFLNVMPKTRIECDTMRSVLDRIMNEYKNPTKDSDPEIELSFSNIPDRGERRDEFESRRKKVKVFIRKAREES